MNLQEIKKNLLPEDKMMCAVKFETHESYINQILRGHRRTESPKAQAIVAELTRLAQINISARNKKVAV
jgi:hypothetical protein